MANVFAFFAIHFDLPILQWIATHLRCDFLDAVMPVITLLGDAGIFWIAVAVVMLLIPKYRKIGLSMGLALLIGVLVCNVTMKPLFARIRPYDFQLEHFGNTIPLLIAAPHDFSFPSGHTLASFEGAVSIFAYHRKSGTAALLLAAMIAFSRLYLMVHYPMDVITGAVLGSAFAFIAVRLTGWICRRTEGNL